MYLTGTKEEFDIWHTQAKQMEGIPPEGKVGYVNGVPAPNNQRTMAVSDPIEHPTIKGLFFWKTMGARFGEVKTEDEVELLGFPVVKRPTGKVTIK